MNNRRRRIFVSLACVGIALLCVVHIDQMFLDGHLGYAGALRGVIGSNYLRFDPMETCFAPLQNAGPSHDGPPSVRYNHPPLAGMLVGLAFTLHGEPSAAVARLVPLAASVLTVPFLFGFLRRTWNEAIAVRGVLLWCVSPFVAIYGAMVSYEPLVLCAWLALLWSWSRWSNEGPSTGRSILAGVAIVVGVWTDWPMVALTTGLLFFEGYCVIKRRPRRPGFLIITTMSLLAALGLLAFYYLVVLDIDREGLETLYQARSSIGRWAVKDVVFHVAHRTVTLVTWPIVIASILGLIMLHFFSMAGKGTIMIVLLLPPLGLLLLLPQHAVIHCFSAWYLLPFFVTTGATALWLGARLLSASFGRVAMFLCGLVFAALILWSSARVVADGWVSDGSPLENQPRIKYRHLLLAQWAGEITEEDDTLLIDPMTGVIGVRAWFLHSRAVERLPQARTPISVRSLEKRTGSLALLSRQRLSPDVFQQLAKRWPTTIVAGIVAVDMRDSHEDSKSVPVFELNEEAPSLWWSIIRSVSYPPHRLVEAPARSAVYRNQIWGADNRQVPAFAVASLARVSLTELTALHLLGDSDDRRFMLEKHIVAGLSHRVEHQICSDLEWVGTRFTIAPQGALDVAILLRTSDRWITSSQLPRLSAFLESERRGLHRSFPWTVVSDDFYDWPASSFIVATHRISNILPAGRYRLELRGCQQRRQSPSTTLAPRTILPVMGRIGRI